VNKALKRLFAIRAKGAEQPADPTQERYTALKEDRSMTCLKAVGSVTDPRSFACLENE
jgi:hypothetical protein